MEREQETDHSSATTEGKRTGRAWNQGFTWTERFTGPISYVRYTDTDGEGRPSIIFKFDQPPGGADLPQAVYDVLHDMKHLNRGDKWGGGKYESGLRFKRDKKHGRVWTLPNNSTGRTTADVLDARLLDIAEKIQQEPTQSR